MSSDWIVCEFCEGTGRIPADDDSRSRLQKCDDCNGAGGYGFIPEDKIDQRSVHTVEKPKPAPKPKNSGPNAFWEPVVGEKVRPRGSKSGTVYTVLQITRYSRVYTELGSYSLDHFRRGYEKAEDADG